MAHTVAVADGALLVAPELYQCVSDIVPVGIDVAGFWTALAGLVSEYGPRNKVHAQPLSRRPQVTSACR
eukprot:SAG25_NODE_22_length_22323_cov_52.926874_6_plen_69_part_00